MATRINPLVRTPPIVDPLPGPRRDAVPPVIGSGEAGTSPAPATDRASLGDRGGAPPRNAPESSSEKKERLRREKEAREAATTPVDVSQVPVQEDRNVSGTFGLGIVPVDPFRALVANTAVFDAFITGEPLSAEAVNNLIIRNGLELAANNPLTTAAVLSLPLGLLRSLSPVGGLVKGIVKQGPKAGVLKDFPLTKTVAELGGESAIIRQAVGGVGQRIATNAASVKLTGNLLSKAGFTLGAASAILAIGGTYPFERFLMEEAMQTINIARRDALQAGLLDEADALSQLQKEMLNPTGWEAILPKIPFVNVYNAAQKNLDVNAATVKVYDQIAADQRIQIETGETEDQKWARVRKQEADQDKAAVDYYNQQRQQMVTWEQGITQEDRAGFEESRENQREADLAFEQRKNLLFEASRERQRGADKEAEDIERAARLEFQRQMNALFGKDTADEITAKVDAEPEMAQEDFTKNLSVSTRIRAGGTLTTKEKKDRKRRFLAKEGNERFKTMSSKQIKKEAAFWKEEGKKLDNKEAEDRQAVADFWFEYRKRVVEMENNSRPSNLSFGLF